MGRRRRAAGYEKLGVGDHPSVGDRVLERLVVARVEIRIGGGEVRDRLIEHRLLADVGRDRHTVTGSGVGPRERPTADPGVPAEHRRVHAVDVDRALPVAQLAPVEVVRRAVEAVVDALPAEEDVAGGLDGALADDDPLAGVGEALGPRKRSSTDGWASLICKNSGSRLSTPSIRTM